MHLQAALFAAQGPIHYPSLDFALRVSSFFNVPVDQLVKDELEVEGHAPE